MKEWKNILVGASMLIREAIAKIDGSSMQIALVVDEQNKLLGTVTDGDVRRGLLRGIALTDETSRIMNTHPTVVQSGEDRAIIFALMKSKGLHQMPIVDKQGCIVGIEILDELLKKTVRDHWVVLMAGGLGTRLSPLTENCPKPMLSVGNKPILENILINFVEQGFRRFYLCVNYKAEMVKEYFNDGSKWGVEIIYVHEQQKLGTAGALSLLPAKPDRPMIVMNGDLLTSLNFDQLLDFHAQNTSKATMCIREYDFQIPYGVVKVDNHIIVGIDEKPIQRFFVNAGIYVLDPVALDHIPTNTYFDMPSLFDKLIQSKCEVAAFPIREYWLDIGRIDDLERAATDFDRQTQ